MSTSQCEMHQVELSGLIDGESGDTLSSLDHVTACDECATFYRRARTLDHHLHRAPSELRPPREASGVTKRIAAPRTRWWKNRRVAQGLSHVAMLALGVGLVFALSPSGGAPTQWSRDVGLGSAEMTDERFVEVAVEMLEAQPRYRREMLGLLEEVFHREAEEGSWSLSHARADADPLPVFEGTDTDIRVH